LTSPLHVGCRYYMTRYRLKAETFCRSLAARGLTRQREWPSKAHVPENMFRTYTRPATATQPTRYIVAYQDWTPGARVESPSRFCELTQRKPRHLCVNGCKRKNESRSGECHACRCRRQYRENPEYRERKRIAAKVSKDRHLRRMREDAEYREQFNAKRRTYQARLKAREEAELMLEAA